MLHTTKFVHKFIALIMKVKNKQINHEKNVECFYSTAIVHHNFS